ncbi:MATE efflux family protein [Actinidia rufa]|uniref:Protein DETOXIFICATION n=1 Tax=Actinidia rufa TaxID=165716 RepID=A0A7J0G832_9ERIC|nr:MATE efflux family protein [Actinidia rufa]
MPQTEPKMETNPIEKIPPKPSSPSLVTLKWPPNFIRIALSELRTQRGIALPLVAMNLTWFAKIAITTAFLGRLGELQLAGGALGFTFANVTGFSVLNGLCGAMEPICGQAYGAKNFKLLHKTLLMTTFLLLLTSLPISFLWLNVEKLLIQFGQQHEISIVAKKYLFYLLPDLVVTSFLCPLKTFLSSQNITVPIMFSSGLAVALHVPVNILLCRAKDSKQGRDVEGRWMVGPRRWRLAQAAQAFGAVLPDHLPRVVVHRDLGLANRAAQPCQTGGGRAGHRALNFDCLLYSSVMLSLATCASIRVSNELGANQPGTAHRSAYVSLAVSVVSGCTGCLVMVAAKGIWGPLFTHNEAVIRGVKKMLLLMAVVEVVNFPVAICGGIVRGTARPWLAMYANLGGFYLMALPFSVILAFKVSLGLSGLLVGFFIGMVACLVLLLVFVAKIDWVKEAREAQILTGGLEETVEKSEQDEKCECHL